MEDEIISNVRHSGVVQCIVTSQLSLFFILQYLCIRLQHFASTGLYSHVLLLKFPSGHLAVCRLYFYCLDTVFVVPSTPLHINPGHCPPIVTFSVSTFYLQQISNLTKEQFQVLKMPSPRTFFYNIFKVLLTF